MSDLNTRKNKIIRMSSQARVPATTAPARARQREPAELASRPAAVFGVPQGGRAELFARLGRRDEPRVVAVTPLPASWSRLAGWNEHMGRSYDCTQKSAVLVEMLQLLQREGKLGEAVADVGSGAFHLKDYFPSICVVRIDCAFKYPGGHQGTLDVRANVDLAARNGDVRRALFKKIARFLEASRQTFIGTLVFSDFLNYVNSARVLAVMSRLLPPGGRIVVFNAPDRGYKHLFSPARFKTNSELLAFLRENNFEVKHVTTSGSFEKSRSSRIEEVKDDDQIILVAEKIR